MFSNEHQISRVLIAAFVMAATIAFGATGAVATDSDGMNEATDNIAAADGGAVIGGAQAGMNADNTQEAVVDGAWNGFKAGGVGVAVGSAVGGPAGAAAGGTIAL